MPYIKVYDHHRDVDLQTEINNAQSLRARARGYGVSEVPFEGIAFIPDHWMKPEDGAPESPDEAAPKRRGRPKKAEEPAE